MGKGLVSVARTTDRAQGVRDALAALGQNPVRGQAVFLKPNANTADPCPCSTHNDTLIALVNALWDMGAASVGLGERSWQPTGQVMADKGVLPLLKDLGVEVMDFDKLPAKDMERPIFAQEQIARAAELGLGAAGPGEIELVAPDQAGREYARRLRAILDRGRGPRPPAGGPPAAVL